MIRKVLLLAVSLLASLSVSAQWAGSGTSSDPYKIANAEDLLALANQVNKGNSFTGVCFRLTGEINLNGAGSPTKGWKPIGSIGGKAFEGSLDGDGYTITGLYVSNTSDSQGLIGYLRFGTVENIVFRDCHVTANNYAAIIVGTNSGTVRRCTVQDSHVSIQGTFHLGGLVAGNVRNGKVLSCLVSNSTVTASSNSKGAGIAGAMYGSTIKNCYATGLNMRGHQFMSGIISNKTGGTIELSNNFYSPDCIGVKGGDGDLDLDSEKSPKGAVRSALSDVSGIGAVAREPAAQPAAAPVEVAKVTPLPSGGGGKVDKGSDAPAAAAQPAATVGATVAAPTAVTVTPVVMAAAASRTASSYIVKTKGVKPQAPKATATAATAQAAATVEPTDFMGKNFPFISMCDWKPGMRFMVIPEKYDLLVNTFCDAQTKREVSSGSLRHKIMVYSGHEDTYDGRVHINFTCEDNGQKYYYELPSGTFGDYCYGKMGVPTLAYLGDVDKARQLLMGETLLTRTQFFRVDTEYDGDGFKEITVEKNKVVTVKAVGVGTRAFPVKIIVEDESGNQYYQNVTMSKTNCGMRDDEFIVDNEKFLFEGSFEFTGAVMAVSDDIRSYIGKTVHNKYPTSMSSKGSGKVRDVTVPRFTGFIIDEIEPIKGSRYFAMTLREVETRRVFYKDVAFTEDDYINEPDGVKEDYFGYIFGMGEGVTHNTSVETRTAIREGRVIPGMTTEEVGLAVGEPSAKIPVGNGLTEWHYPRTNSVLVVTIDENGIVKQAKAREVGQKTSKPRKATTRRKASDTRAGGTWTTGTPL